uniref:hypothetical protein n=1 Tax=Cohnella rhizosphaerae TaxID=1457232 RepID=UPI003B8A8613
MTAYIVFISAGLDNFMASQLMNHASSGNMNASPVYKYGKYSLPNRWLNKVMKPL